MTRILFLLFFLFLFTTTNAQLISNDSAFVSLKKLRGWWMTEGEKINFGEKWDKKNDDTLYCKSFSMKSKTDTMYYEEVTITKDKSGVYYSVKPFGKTKEKPIKFKLTRADNEVYEFTNMSHDFPKRISYYFKSKYYITAYIDDAMENSKKRKYFYYRRIR